MCGIAGFLSGRVPAQFMDTGEALLRRMGEAIGHRGPDDTGVWMDLDAGIGLAHRRLAILDLSSAGHQPMISPSGRYVIVFNGEIYNHQDLRGELEERDGGMNWRGQSDTETLLACFDSVGIVPTIERAIGMFAFGAWDRQLRVLTLGRDRFGEKPLYFGWQGETLLFGSELKALKAHPAFHAGVDRNCVASMLRYSYIPAPRSIYQGIHKVRPGCVVTVSLREREPVSQCYWSSAGIIAQCRSQPFSGTPQESVLALETLLKDAIRKQMLSDVPLGAFLSGGIDSSTVAALMQSQSSRPVRTFSIGFEDDTYNEAPYAKAVARHLGTDHTEMYVSDRDARDVIPMLPSMYDEPFADVSQIPTYLVSRIARQHVTVSLSGDAGDELFCGYNRYVLTAKTWESLAMLPVSLRRGLASALLVASPTTINRMFLPVQFVVPRKARVANWGEKIHKAASVLPSRTAIDLYRGMVSHWHESSRLVKGSHEPDTPPDFPLSPAHGLSVVELMMAMDLVSYLPDDVLCKVDRAAMRVSLETRVPFLDHRVVEFSWRLPLDYKLREGVSKWVLREVLHRYVPRSLIERPKMGFAVPIDAWLRSSLRDWAESLLDESRLLREGYFNPNEIRRCWAEHLSGRGNCQYRLWNVLMFQSWLEQNG